MYMPPPPSVQHRDRGLGLLRDLTVAVAIGATGLLGVFAIAAAATIPGHAAGGVASNGSSGAQTDGGSTSTGFGGQTQLHQPDGGGFTQGGSTTPIVVTGGSR